MSGVETVLFDFDDLFDERERISHTVSCAGGPAAPSVAVPFWPLKVLVFDFFEVFDAESQLRISSAAVKGINVGSGAGVFHVSPACSAVSRFGALLEVEAFEFLWGFTFEPSGRPER